MTRSSAISLILAAMALTALAGCGERGAPQAGNAQDASQSADDATRSLSARELIDATDAIEKLLNAERTAEALLLARKLVERAEPGTAAAATANELCARACFTRSQLPHSGASAAERRALAVEAATHAIRGVEGGAADPGRIAFAALLASNAGRNAEARALFDRALAAGGDDPAVLLQAALAALTDGDPARAESLRSRLGAAAPDDPWFHGLAAEIALVEERYGDAVAHARVASAADRDRLEFRLVLARALRRNDAPADAARLLSALEPAERAKPAIAAQFALALAESGDLAGAARAWDAALRANPADAYVRAEAAVAFLDAGNEARAAAELAALDAMPGGADERLRIAPRLTATPRQTPGEPAPSARP